MLKFTQHLIFTVSADKIEKKKTNTGLNFIVNNDDNNSQVINIIIVIILTVENLKVKDCVSLTIKSQMLSNYNYILEKANLLLNWIF